MSEGGKQFERAKGSSIEIHQFLHFTDDSSEGVEINVRSPSMASPRLVSVLVRSPEDVIIP